MPHFFVITDLSRLGILKADRKIFSDTLGPLDPLYTSSTRQQKVFELSNHLGNVLTAISDKKLGEDDDMNGIADGYIVNIRSRADYYPCLPAGRPSARG